MNGRRPASGACLAEEMAGSSNGGAAKYIILGAIVALGIAIVAAGLAARIAAGSLVGAISAALGLFFIRNERKARAAYGRALNGLSEETPAIDAEDKRSGRPPPAVVP